MKRRIGFIHEQLEIKILILFILRRLPRAITIDALAELVLCDDGINYFDFIACVESLLKTEHIILQDGKYKVTDKGARNGEITEERLPFTVRQVAENTVVTVRTSQNRDAMIKTSKSFNEDGTLTVLLSLSDGLGEITKIELHAVNEHQANEFINGFRKNAEKTYNAMIRTILD
jgi:hypothetical protein